MTSTENYTWTERLSQVHQRNPIEADILAIVSRIEGMGAHPHLTATQNHLMSAVCRIVAWYDSGEPGGIAAAPTYGETGE